MIEYLLLECWHLLTIAYIDIQKMPIWALKLVCCDQTRMVSKTKQTGPTDPHWV